MTSGFAALPGASSLPIKTFPAATTRNFGKALIFHDNDS
jgi:hypothetical protein